MEGYITKLYGEEQHTGFSGNSLDRVSYLRGEPDFFKQAFDSPDARFLVLRNRDLLIKENHNIHWLEREQIANLTGNPYSRSDEDRTANFDFKIDSPGYTYSHVAFLGLDHQVDSTFTFKSYGGAPRFAVDVSTYTHAQPRLKSALEEFYKYTDSLGPQTKFEAERLFMDDFDKYDLSIIAQSRTILDWAMKTRFCAGCGNHIMSSWGGYKMVCPESVNEKTDCLSLHTVCNFAFPRTDCCIIVAVTSFDGEKVLLGRSARFPPKMYSCLAGFLEGGESIEDCVRREVFEEAGVKVGRVVLYASQSWPYPANIMIGCLAEVADASEESHNIFLGHDKELVDAKWVPKAELKELVKTQENDSIKLPPASAIAWNLLDTISKL